MITCPLMIVYRISQSTVPGSFRFVFVCFCAEKGFCGEIFEKFWLKRKGNESGVSKSWSRRRPECPTGGLRDENTK